MTPSTLDPKEQAFIEQALAAAARTQRIDQIRMVVTSAAAIGAAIWFAFRPTSSEMRVEATVTIMIGAMLAAVTAKLRALIQHNTRVLLQALTALRPPSHSVSVNPSDH